MKEKPTGLFFTPRVLPAEAITLSECRPVSEFHLIEAVAEAYLKQRPIPQGSETDGTRRFYTDCFFQAIFTAGRIQGIREERARRNRIKV